MGLLQTFDEAGRLQVDSDMLSFLFYSKGTATTGASLWGATVPSAFWIDVPAYLNRPLIAISCPYFVGIFRSSLVDGVRRFQYVSSAPPGTAFTYYIFESSQSFGGAGWGLETYNESGQLTFSSNAKYMLGRAVLVYSYDGISTTTFPAPASSGSSFSAPGRTLAVAQASYGGHRLNWSGLLAYADGVPAVEEPGGYYDWRYYNDGKVYGGSASGGSVSLGEISFEDVEVALGTGTREWAEAAQPPNFFVPIVAFAIDVTHL